MNIATSLECWVVLVLLTVISFSFIKYLFWGDNSEKTFQKIIGGFSLLVVALISHNSWVLGVAVLVSGLIIASEDFMKFIAAIMRSRGDQVPETIRAFHVQEATRSEVEAKAKSEEIVDEAVSRQNMPVPCIPEDEVQNENQGKTKNAPIAESTNEPRYKESANERANQRLKIRLNIEQLMQPLLVKDYGDCFEPHMKLIAGNKQIIVDGIIKKNNRVSGVVEIKYISPQSFPNIKFLIIRYKEKLKKHGFHGRLNMYIVSNHLSSEDASRMCWDTKGLADLRFFEYTNNQLTEIYPDKNYSPW